MNTMIIVDDEPAFLKFAQKCITTFFPEIQICGCFSDGKESLDFLDKQPVDIVLTDICMPNMDGLDLVREIHDRFPHCVTIIISGYSNFEYARHAIKYDVSNYLTKPLNIHELKPCMEKALALSAARKLIQKNNASMLNEQAEIFFSDLLLGTYTCESDMRRTFDGLNLPFPIEESSGAMIKFSVTPTSAYHQYNADELILSLKNILILTTQNQACYFIQKSGYHFYYFVFGGNSSEQYLQAALQNMQNTLGLSAEAQMIRRFDSLLCFISGDNTSPAHTSKEDSGSNTLIARAIKYMEANYAQNLSREDVAQSVYLSPAHFGLLFKKETGNSFTDYLIGIRMQKAIELLHTNMKVGEIAAKVGYQSKNRFFINFRQYTSYTPTEYRYKVLCMEDVADESANE